MKNTKTKSIVALAIVLVLTVVFGIVGVTGMPLSGDGLYAADRQGHSVRLPCPKVQVANATGGGDAMAAALAACIAHGRPLAECARMAAGAGALACTASETIHPGMSWESIEYIVNTAK